MAAEKKDTILIVDDDRSVLATLYKVITAGGLLAETCQSGLAALDILSGKTFSCILLDINMHDLSGFEVLKTIRERGITTPVIIVSARQEDVDTLYALEIGADDYIIKPFNPVTLAAKVKALIRRSRRGEAGEDPVLTAGSFRYNTSTLRFFKNNTEIPLSAKENAMIKLFIDNVNRVLTKDLIYELVWGNTLIDENAVMVYVNRLRAKLEDDPSKPQHLQTVRGLGYRFVV